MGGAAFSKFSHRYIKLSSWAIEFKLHSEKCVPIYKVLNLIEFLKLAYGRGCSGPTVC